MSRRATAGAARRASASSIYAAAARALRLARPRRPRRERRQDRGHGRGRLPPRDARRCAGDTSSMFLALNRGKRSACLDLKKASGRAAFSSWSSATTCCFEQFRPGVLDRLGLGHATLLDAQPAAHRVRAHGLRARRSAGARARGTTSTTWRAPACWACRGPRARRRRCRAFSSPTSAGGLWCVVGILAALYRRNAAERARRRARQGIVIDVAMLESSMGFAARGLRAALRGSRCRRAATEPLTGGLALYGTYATKDGRYVTLGALEPKFWNAFCAGVGLAARHGRALPGPAPGGAQGEAARALRVADARRMGGLRREHDCCLEPVLEPDELRDDEQLRARGVFFEIDSPWGRIEQLRTPLTEPARRTPPRRARASTPTRSCARPGSTTRRSPRCEPRARDGLEDEDAAGDDGGPLPLGCPSALWTMLRVLRIVFSRRNTCSRSLQAFSGSNSMPSVVPSMVAARSSA